MEVKCNAQAVQYLSTANDSQTSAQRGTQMLGVCPSHEETQRTTEDTKGIIMTPTSTEIPVIPTGTKFSQRESAIRAAVWQVESLIVRMTNSQELDFACDFLMALQERAYQLTHEKLQKREQAKQDIATREAAILRAKPGDRVELLETKAFATSLPGCMNEVFQFQKGHVFRLAKHNVGENGCCVVIDKDDVTAHIPRYMLRIYQPTDALPESGVIHVGGYVRVVEPTDLVTTRMVKRHYTPQQKLIVVSMTPHWLTVTDSKGCFMQVAKNMVVPIEPDELPQPNTTEETSS